MMEDAVHFLSKETVIQAIARSATKVCKFVSEIAEPYCIYFCFILVLLAFFVEDGLLIELFCLNYDL